MSFIKTFNLSRAKKLLFFIGITYLPIFISTFITNDFSAYELIAWAPFGPAKWTFKLVWVVLCALVGYAAYRVDARVTEKKEKQDISRICYFQLIISGLWLIFLFEMGLMLFSLIAMLVLIFFVWALMTNFYNIDRLSGRLALSYLLWCVFMLYHNIGIVILN